MPEHHRAFGSLFFLLHQGKLLWLLNAPVVGRWFRWCMRIRRWDIGPHERICAFAPDHFTVRLGVDRLGRTKYRTDFRTHAKFSKRLYYAFRPLWWTLHAWDWAFADRWIPELSFGFSTLTKYPDADPETNTVDGSAGQTYVIGSGVSWATIRAGAGNSADDSSASGDGGIWITADSVSGNWRALYRGIYLFDTSSLTAAATISATVLSLYGSNKQDDLSITPNVDIYVSGPATNTAVVAGDFDSVLTTSQTGSPITYAGLSVVGYNDFTFNGTGIGNVSKTGISKFGTANANYDVANSAPTWATTNSSGFNTYMADQTGTANDPKLVVTYTRPESYITITKNWALE